MSNYTNAQIVPAALKGIDRESANGNFWTRSDPNGIRTAGWNAGALPSALRSILTSRKTHITTIIYSYSTPIAWLDDGVWITPAVSYSATTSIKHQSQTYRLAGELVPWDCSLAEYERVICDLMRFAYSRNSHRTGILTVCPGPSFTLN